MIIPKRSTVLDNSFQMGPGLQEGFPSRSKLSFIPLCRERVCVCLRLRICDKHQT